MYLLNFKDSPQQSFAHGFLKGLAAPVMLFHSEAAPPVPEVEYLQPPIGSVRDALAGDWKKIGGDMKVVIGRHGKVTDKDAG